MNVRNAKPQGVVSAALLIGLFLVTGADARESDWTTVVNNNDLIPPLYLRNFNSYNQPSVNTDGVVVIRARSRGGPPLGLSREGGDAHPHRDRTARQAVQRLDPVGGQYDFWRGSDLQRGNALRAAHERQAERLF